MVITKRQAYESWQVIKTALNERKCKPLNSKFNCNDEITEDGQLICNKFNTFFVNVCTSISLSKKSLTEYMITNTTDLFILGPVSEIEVLKIISNFKDYSAGWDELTPLMMKNIK